MTEILFFILIPGFVSLELCMPQGKWRDTFRNYSLVLGFALF